MNSEQQRQLIEKYEKLPYSFNKLTQKFQKLVQRVTQEITLDKIQPYIDAKLDSQKKQLLTRICYQAMQQAKIVLKRQINQQLDKDDLKNKLQAFDYMMSRNKILSEMGKDPLRLYDPEEVHLDKVIVYLQNYKKKIKQAETAQENLQFEI